MNPAALWQRKAHKPFRAKTIAKLGSAHVPVHEPRRPAGILAFSALWNIVNGARRRDGRSYRR